MLSICEQMLDEVCLSISIHPLRLVASQRSAFPWFKFCSCYLACLLLVGVGVVAAVVAVVAIVALKSSQSNFMLCVLERNPQFRIVG